MKEIILRSRKNNELCLQMLDGKFSMLFEENPPHQEEAFSIDNPEYAIELFKLLKRCLDMGGFDNLPPDDFEEKTEILV